VTPVALTCPACRREYDVASGILACPGSRPDEEHALRRVLLSGPALGAAVRRSWAAGATRTFDALHPLLSSFHLLGADGYRRVLDRLTERLLGLEGHAFSVTPVTDQPALARALGRTGRLWIKDETGNVTGSHKGRHLMGSLFYLEAVHRLGAARAKRTLTIYSCGNAALAAAAVARAGDYELHAFVPEDVDRRVAALLEERGAVVERIPRAVTGEGDPCYLAFRRAVTDRGWVPFACAGNDNWSNIEGGATLGWELAMQLHDRSEGVDSLVIQVGGGALARSVAQALEEACGVGLMAALPRIHVCQPEGGFPFVRAYLLTLAEIARRSGLPFDLRGGRSADDLPGLADFCRARQDQIGAVAEFARRQYETPAVRGVLRDLPAQRARFMWPWDGAAPHSLAHGILDDVTYDWYDLLRAVLRSGGRAEILDEATIRDAHAAARRHTAIPVCPTGSAGLAGLMQLQRSGVIAPGESVALFFTGFDRGAAR
jgi:threonine synthase